MGSEIHKFDSQLRDGNRKFGDLQLSHTELSSSVDQLKSDVSGVKVTLPSVWLIPLHK